MRLKLILIYLLVLGICAGEESIPVREIEVKPILRVNELKLKYNFKLPPLNPYFSVDSKGDFYFVEFPNHRILKFNRKGNLIKAIGSIGQSDKDLYEPSGLFLKKNMIYVLDRRGLRIKIFSTNGNFISSIPIGIKNARFVDVLAVSDDFLFVSIKYNTKEAYNDKELITVLDRKGEVIRKIGEIIKCNTISGYYTFNLIFMNVVDNIIFGSFKFYPVIFAYNFNGEKLFYKDLRALVKEIQEFSENNEKRGFDKPEATKMEWGFYGSLYCWGFTVDKNRHLYYAFNGKGKKLVLHMNERGELLENIIFKKDGKDVMVTYLLTDDHGDCWGIGTLDYNDFFIFKF
jgi:hypothetical protein